MHEAAVSGDLERVQILLGQGIDKNEANHQGPALIVAAMGGHLPIVQYLVEQGADMEKTDLHGDTPLITASDHGHLDMVRFLLEQGADRDKVGMNGDTPLHCAASGAYAGGEYLETAKLLMRYGAELNARNKQGQLPIDVARTEEIKQAIRDEPRRRMDEAPGKRATEQDRHPNAATSASAQQEENEEEEEEEQSKKKPRLNEGTVAEGETKVAEEDEDSEPSDEEDDD